MVGGMVCQTPHCQQNSLAMAGSLLCYQRLTESDRENSGSPYSMNCYEFLQSGTGCCDFLKFAKIRPVAIPSHRLAASLAMIFVNECL